MKEVSSTNLQHFIYCLLITGVFATPLVLREVFNIESEVAANAGSAICLGLSLLYLYSGFRFTSRVWAIVTAVTVVVLLLLKHR